MTIWKYELKLEPVQVLDVPRYANLLCLQMQHGKPCLWFVVTPGNEKELRQFQTYGTGTESPEIGMVYIGTYQIDEGQFVFHVFEKEIEK